MLDSHVFFIFINCKKYCIYRNSGFAYFCNCEEKCYEQTQHVCSISKLTRNVCKYCRFKRCENLAGMDKRWVLKALKSPEECQQNKANESMITNRDTKEIGKTKKNNSQEEISIVQASVKDIVQKHTQSCVLDLEVCDYSIHKIR